MALDLLGQRYGKTPAQIEAHCWSELRDWLAWSGLAEVVEVNP